MKELRTIISLSYRGFTANIHYSPTDEVFFGKLMGVNDLVLFEGISIEALQKHMQDAVDDYAKSCKELTIKLTLHSPHCLNKLS